MSDAVQQIKDKLNILDVVSPYVELHKAGKNFKGKSPFSAEKTPSFYVSPDRGMYYCFSTSQGGDIFNFVQVMEGVDFKGALKILAEKAGVELVPENPERRSERERLYAALEAATVFYSERLQAKSAAVSYLQERGVSERTIAKWRIGYAPGPPQHGWRELKEHLGTAGYGQDELLKAGLIKTANSGKDPFDVFRDRIVFPMGDSSGRVVAFSGRILSKDSDAPKYVNSPETELYKKSELLFGFDKAKQGIRQLDFSLIVEGQFDVVMCHQAGYTNTVAVSGTALTLQHVQQLERLSDKVVLALDADAAGIRAMQKAAEVMLARGLDVKIAELPLGKDPADLIGAQSADFKKVIKQSVHVIEFLLHVLRREVSDDRSFKLKARTEILPFILLLPSRIDQEHFVELVAAKIGTTVDAVRFELERLREQRSDTPQHATPPDDPVSAAPVEAGGEGLQRAHLYLLAAASVIDASLADAIKTEIAKLKELGELTDPVESELAGTTFMLEQQFAGMSERSIREEVIARLNYLKTGLVRRRLTMAREALQRTESTGGGDEMHETLKEIATYEAKLREPAYDSETVFGVRED